MSTETATDRAAADDRTDDGTALDERVETAARSLGRRVFGDWRGLALFLGAALWCGAQWRVGIFIQDNVTVANALANVAEGRLALVEWPYSLTIGGQPGVVRVNGQYFGRNYGHVLLALPLLWLLQGLTALVAPKLLLAGTWSLGLVALSVLVGRRTGRKRVTSAGSAVAAAVFAGNVFFARALPESILELVALQLSTLLVAALIAVVLYRLVARFHGARVGLVAGAATVAATPVGFWATIPKRHVVTAGAAVVALYWFAVSRDRTDRRGPLARAGAYAVLGLLTTIHPFEAFFLFAVLVPVDLLTAPENSLRSLATVVLVFVVSLLPFFVLNTLISGNPVESPRIVSGYGSGIETSFQSEGSTSGGGGGGANTGSSDAGSTNASGATVSSGSGDGSSSSGPKGGDPSGGDESMFSEIIAFAVSFTVFVGKWLGQSLGVLSQPGRLYHIFVRSGQIPDIWTAVNDYEAIELTLLESFPLVAGLAWLPVAAIKRARARAVAVGITTTRRQTDLLATGFVVVFTLVYLPQLPLQSQITLRYILPVMPLLVYGLARCRFVHRAIRDAPTWLFGGYLATVVAGGVAVTAALTALDPAIGEAMQFHALVGLATAVVGGIAVASWPFHDDVRVVAAGLALPAGATTVFLVLAKVEYFGYRLPSGVNPTVYVLDLMRVVAELLPIFPA